MADPGDVAVSGAVCLFFLTVISESNPTGGFDVCLLCFVLSGRLLFAAPIPSLEGS
jgi:hypothetical protein